MIGAADKGSDSDNETGCDDKRFDPLRDDHLDEELQITRPPGQPGGAKGKKKKKKSADDPGEAPPSAPPTATTTPAEPDEGGAVPHEPEKPEKPKKPRANRSNGVRAATAKRTLAEYQDVTKPIAKVDGLAILGRGDVIDKRKWKIPEGDAQITEGSLGITRLMATQMQRSLEYAKRANRPRIICSSADQYCIESR